MGPDANEGPLFSSQDVIDYAGMKSLKEITRGSAFEFYEYIVKCLAGVSVGYVLLKAFPQESGQYSWLLISILLSITHDNNSKAAHDRMRGNIVGSLVGFIVFFLRNPPNLLTIGIGVVVTITLCFRLDLIGVCRTALVAFIIVVIYEEAHSSWMGAIYRMVSVVLGCLIGLVINHTFRRITLPMLQRMEHEASSDEAGE
jgi:uncharacterized membrane protein YgaE (UPF0421/DUF939 family)